MRAGSLLRTRTAARGDGVTGVQLAGSPACVTALADAFADMPGVSVLTRSDPYPALRGAEIGIDLTVFVEDAPL